MTEADLSEVEAELGITLPDFYRTTMLNYPFPEKSYVAQSSLVNDPKAILKYLRMTWGLPGIGRPYGVGSDGGEEVYFIDLTASDTRVYVYNHETAKHHVLAKDWEAYLSGIRIEQEQKPEEVGSRPAKTEKWVFALVITLIVLFVIWSWMRM